MPQSKIIALDYVSIGVVGKIILLFPYRWLEESESDGRDLLWRGKDLKGLEGDWILEIGGCTIPMANKNALTLWSCGESAKLVSIKYFFGLC